MLRIPASKLAMLFVKVRKLGTIVIQSALCRGRNCTMEMSIYFQRSGFHACTIAILQEMDSLLSMY